MDKLQWFKFRPSDWTMGRIQKTSNAVQGEFMKFCCSYWNKQCDMTTTQAQFEFTNKAWKKLIDLEIIKINEGRAHVLFLDEQMLGIDDMRQKASKAGQASAKKRIENKRSSTTVQRNPTEKRREEKKENIYRAFDHLSMSNEEFKKLNKEYDAEMINFVLDQISNYKKNTAYKSLYLTCQSWLKREPKRTDQKSDTFYNNVMNQIKKP